MALESLVGSRPRLLVKQVKEWGEILIGFESRNRYEVCDESGEVLGYAAEESGGFGRMILRNLFGRCRACKIHIYDPDGAEIATGVKPFRFFFHRMDLFEQGEKLGAIQRRWSFFHRRFTLEDASGQELLEIKSPWLRIWTFKLHKEGVEVGRISKRWGGLLKEMFSDADTFGVEFSRGDLPMVLRKLLLIGVFLVDFTCFENNSNSGGVAGNLLDWS